MGRVQNKLKLSTEMPLMFLNRNTSSARCQMCSLTEVKTDGDAIKVKASAPNIGPSPPRGRDVPGSRGAGGPPPTCCGARAPPAEAGRSGGARRSGPAPLGRTRRRLMSHFRPPDSASFTRETVLTSSVE